jgi:hypothetical protein
MAKNSEITSITGMGDLKLKHGTFFKWEIKMENGDVGECLTKDAEHKNYIVGESIDYEIKESGNFTNIKKVYNDNMNFSNYNVSDDNRNKTICRQTAGKIAGDFVIANGGGIADIILNADRLTHYFLTGELPNKDGGEMPF